MATTYTIPNRPSGSDVRSIGAILADFDAVLAALNSFDGGNLQAGTVLAAALNDGAKLGLTDGATVRRGKSIIATEESRTNVAYGTLATPDQVQNIVLPTDGLIYMSYRAMLKSSVSAVGRIAVFVGANQVKQNVGGAAAPAVVETPFATTVDSYGEIATNGSFAFSDSSGVAYTGDVTTGQTMGAPFAIFAAAGTYTVSVQFKSSSGSITAKERKLWVWTIGF